MNTSAVEATPSHDHAATSLAPWERAVSWLILLVGAIGFFGFPYAAGSDWSLVLQLMNQGVLPLWAPVVPLIFFVASILLVIRNRWALPLFVIHIPFAILYLAARNGVGSISAFWWFGYACEALIVWLCVRLRRRGALR